MAYQGLFVQDGVVDQTADIDGSALIGTRVNAPFSIHKDGVRVLPMESILPTVSETHFLATAWHV